MTVLSRVRLDPSDDSSALRPEAGKRHLPN
jgi:hypothetical protein